MEREEQQKYDRNHPYAKEIAEAEKKEREERHEKAEELLIQNTIELGETFFSLGKPFLIVILICALIGHVMTRAGDFLYVPFAQNAFSSDEYKVEKFLQRAFGTKSITHTMDRDVKILVADSFRQRAVQDVQKLDDKKYAARLIVGKRARDFLPQFEALTSGWKNNEWIRSNVDSIFLESYLFDVRILKRDFEVLKTTSGKELFGRVFSEGRITVGEGLKEAASSKDTRLKQNAGRLLAEIREAAGSLPSGWEKKYVQPPKMITLPKGRELADFFIPIAGVAFIIVMFSFLGSSSAKDAEHSNFLGVKLYSGTGGKTDFEEAARLFSRAAGCGHADATYNLGMMHLEGKYFEKNEEKARELFIKAAKRDSAAALLLLGEWRLDEGVVGRAREEALGMIRRAAAKGYPEAVNRLGEMSEDGVFGDEEKANAFGLYMKATEKGHAEAMYNAGRMLVYGEGVPRNVDEGIKLLSRAAGKGVRKAAQLFQDIEKYGVDAL